MATIKDIANKLGISISTVSKGLNGASDVSDELRQTILDTAVEMGYTTKRMKKEEHKKLCIFIENIAYETPSDFGYDVVLGFKQAAFRDNWSVNVIPVTPAFQKQEKYDTFMLKNGYSGGFLVSFSLEDAWMEQLSGTKIPTALFDNFIKRNPYVAYVGTDSFEGIESSVDHLIRLGHSKIAFMNGSKPSMVTDHRGQAYYEAMALHGLSVNENMIAFSHYKPSAVYKFIQYHVPRFLEEGATAIICATDLIAFHVMEECKKLGYHVPNDISVIGFDDLPLSAHSVPPLTTIRQDRIELGKCGYMALHSLMNHVSVSKNLLRPQFILRNSTSKAIDR